MDLDTALTTMTTQMTEKEMQARIIALEETTEILRELIGNQIKINKSVQEMLSMLTPGAKNVAN